MFQCTGHRHGDDVWNVVGVPVIVDPKRRIVEEISVGGGQVSEVWSHLVQRVVIARPYRVAAVHLSRQALEADGKLVRVHEKIHIVRLELGDGCDNRWIVQNVLAGEAAVSEEDDIFAQIVQLSIRQRRVRKSPQSGVQPRHEGGHVRVQHRGLICEIENF